MRKKPRARSDISRWKMRIAKSALQAAMRLGSAVALIGLALSVPAAAQTVDISQFVQAMGNRIDDTTIVVERQSDQKIWVSNQERAQQRFSPASTSKIPHTLIALESGLASPSTVYRWDGVFRRVRAWNQDHTLASAFKNSVVWVYQVIAETAGQQTMSDGLARLSYGNTTVGSIDHLTTYWLDGTLRISAMEQIDFLSRLALKQLPLSETTYAAAREIMVSDETADWVMRSKTGWRHSDETMDIGWYVGWVECPSDVYVFAVNLDMPDTRSLSKRKEIAYSVLQEIGAFGCGS